MAQYRRLAIRGVMRMGSALAEFEGHFPDGRGLRVDPVDVGVAVVRIMMVDIDLEIAVEVLVAGPGDVGAFEKDDRVVDVRGDLADRIRAASGKAWNGTGVLSLLMMATSLPICSAAKARARQVQRESPSGRRWEVIARRRLSAIFLTMRSRGVVFIFLGRLKDPLDPFAHVRRRIQSKK